MSAKKQIGNSGGSSHKCHNRNMDPEQLDSFINSILQAKTFDEALQIVDESMQITVIDTEAAKLYSVEELKLKGTQMLLVTLVKYIIASQHLNAQESFEMSLLHNTCQCTEN